ncbi:MAG: DUF222 domain-containing protein [Actinobacteria bacterium]|nr:DUF222 domain-containing protein [Actinomycetota bacterium]
MREDPFPGPGRDGDEPDGSQPLPADGTGLGGSAIGDGAPDEEGGAGPEQGLFVCLPAEELTLAGFCQDGRAPGPLLAAVVHAAVGADGAGLAGLSEDQLIGVISAARRIEARAAWTQLAAVAEFARRRPASHPAAAFAADELAAEFRQSAACAAGLIGYAQAVAARLPRTFAALAAGLIHPVHLRIIEDETRFLTDQDAAAADEQLAEAARDASFGRLRSAARRLVLELDPEAAARRKAAAGREAQVRRFREESGNAGMVARELPCEEVLASWQHVEQRALDLRAAGVPGSLQELRCRAYLDLLQERDSRAAAGDPDPGQPGQADGAAGTEGAGGGLGGDTDPGGPREGGGPGGPQDENGDPPGTPGSRPGPAGTGAGRPARDAPETDGASLAAVVNITVPLATLAGRSVTPGEVAGFGLVDAGDAAGLIAAAARHPRTRWCLTAVYPDGTAAAHGCAAGPHGWPGGTGAMGFVDVLKIRLTPVIRGPCGHARAERGYRPSRALRHRVTARNARCTAPGCSRPAAGCDLDHTKAWHHGGVTCECNLAPLCRHHHRCKQAEGWRLEQPEPGVLTWRTPGGRTYATTPTEYPV